MSNIVWRRITDKTIRTDMVSHPAQLTNSQEYGLNADDYKCEQELARSLIDCEIQHHVSIRLSVF